MTVVNIHDAKSRLSELLREVEAGGDVIVARHGTPVAKIVPWPPKRPPRAMGAWKGRVRYDSGIVESDPDVVALFEESSGQE